MAPVKISPPRIAVFHARQPQRRLKKMAAATQSPPPHIIHKNAEKTARKSTCARTAADQAFALHPLASQLANAANGFCLFAGALLRRLLVVVAHLHFAENAFALHLLLESAERLVNVVVADKYLHVKSRSFGFVLSQQEE
jgi:hypothetical protein